MTEDSSEFTEEEATRIWRRVAELQAARRLPLSRPTESEPEGDADAEVARLSNAEVRDVAREAGIDPEFVDRALAEAALSAPSLADEDVPMQARRRISAPLGTVRRELLEVAARDAYSLRLADIRSAGEGHAMDFTFEGPSAMVGGALRAGDFGAGRTMRGVRAVLLPADVPDETDLILYSIPNPGLPRSRTNHDIGFGAIGSVLGASAVGAAGVELLALTGAAVLAPIAVGAVALGAAGVAFVRRLHRRAVRVDAASLEHLADEVVGAVRIRSFTRTLPPSGEDSGSAPGTVG
jgi:hypothetical protein